MNFKNKTILITGASSGLGRALAIALSKKGAHLILVARNSQALEETARLCDGSPFSIQADVSCEADCLNAVTSGVNHYGQLDYLILNAGVSMWTRFDTLSDLSIIHKLMNTNFFGAVNFTRFALPYLKKSQGMIVAISSIQGKLGVPFHSGYAASKHALHGFFDTLRMELKNDHVDVLTVMPGWIQDTALKKHALGKSEDTAAVIQRKHKNSSLPMSVCTHRIIQAMQKRKRELIMPRLYRGALWLKLLSPKVLDFFVRRNVE